MKQTVIVAGGPLNHDFAARFIKEEREKYSEQTLIAADAGLDFCVGAGLVPDLLVGDFDSSKSGAVSDFAKKYPERIRRFPSQKNETDTELALLEALKDPGTEVVVLGGLGGRVDHLLGNIHLLEMARRWQVDLLLVDEKTRIRLIDHAMEMPADAMRYDYVSLVPYGGEVHGLTLRGFEYEVTGFTLLSDRSRGLSNHILCEGATIDFDEGMLLVIEVLE